MKHVYNMLNDIDTDFSEFEEDTLSEIEIAKINKRLKSKLNSDKGKNSKNTMIWLGKAAVIVLGCLTVGGGVYAAANYRKNVKDEFRFKSTESAIVSEEETKVTKEIHDNVTGGTVTYDASKNDKANIDIINISNNPDSPIFKVGIKIVFDQSIDLTELKTNLDKLHENGIGWNYNDEQTGIGLKTALEGEEVDSWANAFRFEENSLYLDFFMGNMFTKNWSEFENAINEAKANGTFTGPLTADASKEEIDEFTEKYGVYLKAPELVGGTIDISLELPKEYGGTYTVSTKIDESMLVEDTSNLISIDPISAELDEYGLKEKMVIDSYAIGATGFRAHGTWEYNTDWNELNKYCEDNGIEASGDLKIRAWDDLGNYYLLILANNSDGTFYADLSVII